MDENETDALTIGRRIRQLRTARGMTFDDLATAGAFQPDAHGGAEGFLATLRVRP